MKFEINKDKLEQVIFKYLDTRNFIIKETDDNYYFLDRTTDFLAFSYNKSKYLCIIYYEVFKEIRNFFSIDDTKTIKNVISKYVQNKLNVEVSSTVVT